MRSDDSIQHLKLMSREKPLSRRDFMRVATVASAAGPGLAAAAFTGLNMTSSQRAEAAELIVDGLGKVTKARYGTRHGNMMVSRMCMSSDWNGELLAPALEMGVNFIHKAGYWGGNVPASIKKLPRDSYYTDITVDNTSPGHNADNYDEAYGQVVTSLAQNGLQYYDVYRAHYGWHNLASFNKGDNASYRAFKKLKAEGKVKYFGVSQHPYSEMDNGNPEKIEKYADLINAEIESGLVDSMQVWYSYGYPPAVKEVFAKASKAGIAMVAMKVWSHGHDKMRGDAAKMTELRADGKVGRALIREVMNEKRPDGKPIFCTCVSALGSMDVFEDNIGGVSPKLAMRDGFAPTLA